MPDIFKCLLADINTKQFCNILEKKFFAPLRILYLFIKSCTNPFDDITLTFSHSSSRLFSTSKFFVLFEVNFVFKFFSLSLKSVFFFTKSAISSLVANFACANLAAKFSYVELLNS